jgi:hypothetical protein
MDCKALPGYYSANGNAASVCPTGFYCKGGSAVVRCPAGTTSAEGAADVVQCSVMRSYYGRLEFERERGVFRKRFILSIILGCAADL